MSDIVKRLRAWERGECRTNPPGLETIFMSTDAKLAADEIERLRGLLREAREMADNWPGIAYSADLTARIDAALGEPFTPERG